MKTVLIGGPHEGVNDDVGFALGPRLRFPDDSYYELEYATGTIRQYRYKGSWGGAQEGARWAPPVGTPKPLQMRDFGGVPKSTPPSLEGGGVTPGHPLESLHRELDEGIDIEDDVFPIVVSAEAGAEIRETEDRKVEDTAPARLAESWASMDERGVDDRGPEEVPNSLDLTARSELYELVSKYGYMAGRVLERMWNGPWPDRVEDGSREVERPEQATAEYVRERQAEQHRRVMEKRMAGTPSIGSFHTSELVLLAEATRIAFSAKCGRIGSEEWETWKELMYKVAKLSDASRAVTSDGVDRLWSLEPQESETRKSERKD